MDTGTFQLVITYLIKLIKRIIFLIGLVASLIELLSFKNPEIVHKFESIDIKYVLGVILFCSIIFSIPRLSNKFKVSERDVFITLKIKDAFKINGSVVIPVNNNFLIHDVENVKNLSLECQLLKKVFKNNKSELEDKIKTELEKSEYRDKILDKTKEIFEYQIGTTIQISKNNRKFYLLAFTYSNDLGNPIGENSHLDESLEKFWFWMKENPNNDDVIFPLIGSGKAKFSTPRELIVRKIIKSFLYLSNDKNLCDNLIIPIRMKDILVYKLNIGKIVNMIECSSTHPDFDEEILKESIDY